MSLTSILFFVYMRYNMYTKEHFEIEIHKKTEDKFVCKMSRFTHSFYKENVVHKKLFMNEIKIFDKENNMKSSSLQVTTSSDQASEPFIDLELNLTSNQTDLGPEINRILAKRMSDLYE